MSFTFVLLPRANEYSMNDNVGISTPILIGIVLVAVAAVALAVLLAVTYFRRRRLASSAPRNVLPFINSEKELWSSDEPQSLDRPPVSLARSVSRHNLTPSIVLPVPVPPIPAARPRPPKNTASPRRPLSNAEVLAHHDATGTMPRTFGPVPISAFSGSSVPSPGPSLDRAAAPSHTTPSRPGSVVSFSRASILSASLHNSSLGVSPLSSSTGTTTAIGALKVCNVFTPLLPDELVVRRGERVALVQAYDDGWHIVGRRRAAWMPKTPPPGDAAQYPFGQAAASSASDEVELGAVPAWIFQRGSGPQERPVRSASLGVTVALAENERREDVISWSNF